MNTRKFEYGFYSDCLRECFMRFGSIKDLPILKRHQKRIVDLYHSGKVLDVGAGKEKPLQKSLRLKDDLYFSLDNDPCGDFTYSSAEEIPNDERFSLIVANQLFEHISLQDSIDLFCILSKHLEKNGYLISTVPNIHHPVRQRTNITHITYWEYKALYMLYKYAGLEVIEISRYSKRHPKGIIERILARYINQIYRIDWCDSILIIGKK